MNRKTNFLIFVILSIFVLNVFGTVIQLEAMQGSLLKVNGFAKDFNNGGFEVTQGKYFIQVFKTGYTDYATNITVKDEKVINIKAEQIPLTEIVLKSNTKNFTVKYMINNQELFQVVPDEAIIRVPSTVNSLTFEKNGYYTKKVEVKLKPFWTNEINIPLRSLGTKLIQSMPDKANVFIDDKFVGTTPFEYDFKEPVNIELVIKKEGFVDFYRTVKPEEEQVSVTLEKGTEVRIDSVPEGAGVVLNGKIVGITPFRTSLPYGNYSFQVSKPNYESKTFPIVINKDSVYNNFRVELERTYRNIMLLNTVDLLLSIDGFPIGKGVSKLVLDNKMHILKATNSRNDTIAIVIDRSTQNVINFDNLSVVNVYSAQNNTYFVNDTIKKAPSQVLINLVSENQDFSFRNIYSRDFFMKLKKFKPTEVFIDGDAGDVGYVSFSSNVVDALVSIDGVMMDSSSFFGKVFKAGMHTIEAKYQNMAKSQNFEVRPNQNNYLAFYFEEKFPVKITSTKPIRFNDIEYLEFPRTVYINKGYQLIEVNGKRIALFVDTPEIINIDDIMN